MRGFLFEISEIQDAGVVGVEGGPVNDSIYISKPGR